MLGWHDTRSLSSLLPKKEANAFRKHFGYETAEDLLLHFPRTWAPHGGSLGKGTFDEGDIVTIIGTITQARSSVARNGQNLYQITIEDEPYRAQAIFFRAGPWLSSTLTVGTRAMFFGKYKHSNFGDVLQHPDYLVLPRIGEKKRTTGALGTLTKYGDIADITNVLANLDFMPIYPAKTKVATWSIFGAIHHILSNTAAIPDPLGPFAPADLPSFDEALRHIHEPGEEGPDHGLDRMRYNEAIEIALVMALRRATNIKRAATALPVVEGARRTQLLKSLPFALTAGQQEVIEEISAELAKPRPMQRLLEGEVGSGKTIVSIFAMLQAIDQGMQCALLAPTEVLATQHARSIQSTLTQAGVTAKVVTLIGSLNTKQRKQALLDIISGEADIVVGTHAIIQDTVDFFNLGLVVIDEQHRFGVEQRDHLRTKGPDGLTPHVLVMTATPIPRTVAMTSFGDLSLSVLRELPGGRKPISSFVVAESNKAWLTRAFQRMREEVESGRQVYVVAPRIQGEGGVEDVFDRFRDRIFPELRVGILHGRMPADAKEEVMLAFTRGELDVLVATTVIEVGVDVPNATVMMILESERFGVSQLHQLRGRVGRGGNASLCFFHVSEGVSEEAFERVSAVAATTNGFELAEIDLAYRHEGDVLGTRQSGANRLKLLRLARDRELIERANRDAAYLVARDPELAERLIQDVSFEQQEYIEKS